jgi:sugar phosphate isomerase/epimerase
LKAGISSYSLHKATSSGEMSFLDGITWAKHLGAEHFEVVPLGFDLIDSPTMVKEIRSRAKEEGIELSNYAIRANFVRETQGEYEQEVERVKKQVDIAGELGVKFMRHDVATRSPQEASISKYYGDLPLLVEACREIADYAASYGITTSIENHGYYIQDSDRVKLLVDQVDRKNFRTTLDIGNFLCADENPLLAVQNNISIASMVHIKDFYHRSASKEPGEGWFSTRGGNHLRGAIVGHGDLPMKDLLHVIKQSGYDGFLSLEFEGMEDCKTGTRIGFDNLKRLWAEG